MNTTCKSSESQTIIPKELYTKIYSSTREPAATPTSKTHQFSDISSKNNNQLTLNPCRSLLAVSISIALTSIVGESSFAATNYNGSSTQITSSASVGGNFDQFVGTPTLNGVVDFGTPPSAVPLSSNAEITINYSSGSILEFALSGYAFSNPNNLAEASSASNNKTQLLQGDINDNTYTGLSHVTLVNSAVDCNNATDNCSEATSQTSIDNKTLTTNSNTTNLSGTLLLNIAGDINSGNSEIRIKNGDLISASPSAVPAQSSVLDDIGRNTLHSNSNSTTISRNNQQLNNISTGYSGINANYGEVRGGTSTTLSNSRGSAISQTTGNSNSLNTIGNSFIINGNSNAFNISRIGLNEFIVEREDTVAQPANTTSPSFQYASASANANNNSILRLNTLTSTNNTASITGGDNTANAIEVGKNLFSVIHSAVTSGTSDSYGSASSYAVSQINLSGGTLVSKENKIIISGDRNSLGNLSAGHSQVKVASGNVTAMSSNSTISTANASATAFTNLRDINLSANNNEIEINGNSNTLGNLTAGYSGLSITYNSITSGTGAGTTLNDDSALNIITANATLSANNNIEINGTSTITGNIHTGYIDYSIIHGAVKKANGDDGVINVNATGSRAFATGNTLSISGEHTINNPGSSIYGGYLEYKPGYKPETYDVFTGNTLNYKNTKPISIGELANFQTYNFTLNPLYANTPTALITANHINLGSDLTNISDGRPEVKSDIYVTYISAGQIVPNDSEFILMESINLEGNGVGHRTDSVAQQGISLVYDVSTFIRGNQVIAIVEGGPSIINPNPPPQGPEANPQLKALLAGNLAGLMLITRGADNISDNIFSAIDEQNKKRGLVPFVNISANHSRYDTGSHIKSDGGIITTGLSYQNEQWTAGAFIEYGRDNYKTFNEFKNFKDTRGSGHNRFTGIGIYSHYDFANGWYLDGSLRGGRLHTNFSSNDIQHPDNGITAKYNVKGNYYSMHLSAGHTFEVTEKNSLDTSVKYLWSSTDGNKIEIAGEPIKFNKINSHRLRLNAENTYQVNEEIGFISGLAYEYEFDGKAKGTALGAFHIPEPSVKGSTGVATIGVRYQPQLVPNLTLDLKASGYFGKREGGSGLLHMSYSF